MRVSLVDYGAGNLASVIKGLRAVGAEVTMARAPEEIGESEAIVIPGVGHFSATRALGPEWHAAVHQRIAAGAGVLGICLGMQWLFEGSAEAPDVPGLGVFSGHSVRLTGEVKVPHVGWNTLTPVGSSSRILEGVPAEAYAYFTHSFGAPVTSGVVATTTHGVTFASVAERGRVCGAQWHPEKSSDTGLRLLRNFLTLASEGR